LKIENINTIKVKGDGFSLKLEKEGSLWILKKGKGVRGNQGRVKNIIKNIKSMSILSLASKEKSKFKTYGVDKAKGTVIEGLNNNKRIFCVIIGKTAQDYLHCFIRKPESSEVFLVNRNFAKYLNKFNWEESRVLDIDESSIEFLSYREGMGRIFYFSKKAGFWGEKNSSKAPDQKQLKLLLGSITDLMIDQASPKIKQDYFSTPKLSITVTCKNGFRDGFVVGKLDEGERGFYVRRALDGHVFLVKDFRINSIISRKTDLYLPLEGVGD